MAGSKITKGKTELVHRYFDAYRTCERAIVENGMTDDFRFTSPYDDAIDKATYFERCWPNCEVMQRLDIERVFEQGEQAFVTYLFTGTGGKQFRNTEFWTFAGDCIREVHVYFGETYQDGKFIKQQLPA
jgi:hypothetical protein